MVISRPAAGCDGVVCGVGVIAGENVIAESLTSKSSTTISTSESSSSYDEFVCTGIVISWPPATCGVISTTNCASESSSSLSASSKPKFMVISRPAAGCDGVTSGVGVIAGENVMAESLTSKSSTTISTSESSSSYDEFVCTGIVISWPPATCGVISTTNCASESSSSLSASSKPKFMVISRPAAGCDGVISGVGSITIPPTSRLSTTISPSESSSSYEAFELTCIVIS